MKSGNLNFLEPSGPLQACNGTAFCSCLYGCVPVCMVVFLFVWLYSCLYGCIPVYIVVFLFNTVIYVFLLLCLYFLIVCLCIFIVPTGTLRLPWLRFFRAFSSTVLQMPWYNPQRQGTARTLPKIFVLFYVLFVFCRSVYCVFVNVYCTAIQLQFNKYIIIIIIIIIIIL